MLRQAHALHAPMPRTRPPWSLAAASAEGRARLAATERDADALAGISQRNSILELIGNGDVKSPANARRMLMETGCDGAMVGRSAISNPWVMRDIQRDLAGLPPLPAPTIQERVETALEHLRLMIACEAEAENVDDFAEAMQRAPQTDAELRACRALRGQMPLYIKGEIGASQLRDQLTKCSTYDQYEILLRGFVEKAEKRHLVGASA